MSNWTIADVIERLPRPQMPQLDAPSYSPGNRNGLHRAALAVESMRNHTTDEGWQIMLGLEENGYKLFGRRINDNLTSVPMIVETYDPDVVLVQDKREWDGKTAGKGFDESERFASVDYLRACENVFKVTILKDAQNNPPYHAESAVEMGCHSWVVYYHPDIVCHVAPFVRPQHVVRTYHSVDNLAMPIWKSGPQRKKAVVSGAVSGAYPLRTRLLHSPYFDWIHHPGYGRNKCYTPEYLAKLSEYKVAVCTASRYGYVLRKIIEASAVGCIVVTDLPSDEVLPYIDKNLVRVHNDASEATVREAVDYAETKWDETYQAHVATVTRLNYDYQALGRRLVDDIEAMRRNYR